jgi:hypothetical protein
VRSPRWEEKTRARLLQSRALTTCAVSSWESEELDERPHALFLISSLVKTDQSDSNRSGKKRRKPRQWSRATGLVG